MFFFKDNIIISISSIRSKYYLSECALTCKAQLHRTGLGKCLGVDFDQFVNVKNMAAEIRLQIVF